MTFLTELKIAKKIAKEAGEYILCNSPNNVEYKTDGSPVSDLDKKVSNIIFEKLSTEFPHYGILDEERENDSIATKKEVCWVVDPIDATSDLLHKGNNYGIIIGLMHNLKPVLGVTYRPKLDELVFATEGKGAFIQTENETTRIHVKRNSKILVSYVISAELQILLNNFPEYEIIKQPGSLKTIEVAKGNAALFLCNPINLMYAWDICGPSVILNEAGGQITDFYGNSIEFTQKDGANKKGLIASNGFSHQDIIDKVKIIHDVL